MEQQSREGFAIFETIQTAVAETVRRTDQRLTGLEDALVDQAEDQARLVSRFHEAGQRLEAALEMLRTIRRAADEALEQVAAEIAAVETALGEQIRWASALEADQDRGSGSREAS